MRRLLLTLCSALSLLLFVAVCALWVRSYWVEEFVLLGSDRLHRFASGGGGVAVQSLELVHRRGDWRTGLNPATKDLAAYTQTRLHYLAAQPRPRCWEWSARPFRGGPRFWAVTRVWADPPAKPRVVPTAWKQSARFDNATGRCDEVWMIGRSAWLPYWLPAALFAALPAAWLRRHLVELRQDRRRQMGVCPACGYDLRASPGRCPECGMVNTPLAPAAE